MSRATAALTAVATLTLAGLAYSAFAQPPVPISEPPHTLGRFLGIPQAVGGVYDALANRRGNHPRLERKGRGARLRRIADPIFLDPAAPPLLKVAAQIKMQEDLAPQKMKALKYLGSIGCGCYDKDGEVTAALLEGLADCTLEVRLAAVEVIAETAGAYCEFCQERSCCKPALAAKLDEMANGQDENGCWLEPSERVRAAAAQALTQCGPIIVGSEPLPERPIEGPESRPDLPEPDGVAPPPPAPMARPRALPIPQASREGAPASGPKYAPYQDLLDTAAGTPIEWPQSRGEAHQQGPSSPPAAATTHSSAQLATGTDGSKDLMHLFSPPGVERTSHDASDAARAADGGHVYHADADSDAAFSAESFAITAREPHPVSAPPSRPRTSGGVVDAIDVARGVVRVRFDYDGQVPPGTAISIVHETLLGRITVSGRVDQWDSPYAVVRPFDPHAIRRLSRGDHATLYVPRPQTYR